MTSRTQPWQEVRERLRAEYLEMPGLRLKLPQVQRLCGIEEMVCQIVLDSLVEAKFLCRKSDGCYARLTEGQPSGRRPAEADFRPVQHFVKAS